MSPGAGASGARARSGAGIVAAEAGRIASTVAGEAVAVERIAGDAIAIARPGAEVDQPAPFRAERAIAVGHGKLGRLAALRTVDDGCRAAHRPVGPSPANRSIRDCTGSTRSRAALR